MSRPPKQDMTDSEHLLTAPLSDREAAWVISKARGGATHASRRVSHTWVQKQRRKWHETHRGTKLEAGIMASAVAILARNAEPRETQEPEPHSEGGVRLPKSPGHVAGVQQSEPAAAGGNVEVAKGGETA